MTAGREDDALSWDGDDDPTLDAGGARPGFDDMPLDAAAPPVLPPGWTAVGAGADGVRSAGVSGGAEHPERAAHRAHEASGAHKSRDVHSAGDTAAVHGSDDSGNTTDTDANADGAATAPLGNAALVSLGVFGGVFVLYAIGWYLGATRLAAFQVESGLGTLLGMPLLAEDFMYLVWVALVTLAPPIWFLVTLFLTQGSHFWKRFVGLLGGVVLLVPWPFLMIGGAVAI